MSAKSAAPKIDGGTTVATPKATKHAKADAKRKKAAKRLKKAATKVGEQKHAKSAKKKSAKTDKKKLANGAEKKPSATKPGDKKPKKGGGCCGCSKKKKIAPPPPKPSIISQPKPTHVGVQNRPLRPSSAALPRASRTPPPPLVSPAVVATPAPKRSGSTHSSENRKKAKKPMDGAAKGDGTKPLKKTRSNAGSKKNDVVIDKIKRDPQPDDLIPEPTQMSREDACDKRKKVNHGAQSDYCRIPRKFEEFAAREYNWNDLRVREWSWGYSEDLANASWTTRMQAGVIPTLCYRGGVAGPVIYQEQKPWNPYAKQQSNSTAVMASCRSKGRPSRSPKPQGARKGSW
ncbi:hypothetical protein L596_018413 [Steinernema carpocapsae]|uniref:Uncharacterized protein n=1 Tax=Steinernema carpocapsae TaxID=34508 RepID=A0A4U5N4L2_STECR|nr:hypothetical protein L596_018413 [Steinernema carpocapsae]